jgi:PIN domain nuclease of toxin-antitoxin system
MGGDVTVVLDTSELLRWTLSPDSLTPAVRQAIESAERVVISAISIWEIALKVKRGRLDLLSSVEDYVSSLETLHALEIRPVDVQTWLDNVALVWDHRDPADRTIVATAMRLNCPLLTSDRVIADYYPQAVW